MGRNKFSQHEIDIISKLLRKKCASNRFQQKEIRHQLRTNFEFNISDFNVQGKAFGPKELQQCIEKKIIQILDDATIQAMKEKRERDRQKDALSKQTDDITETTDWKAAMKEWDEFISGKTN